MVFTYLRRIQVTGHSTYAVTLPKEWAKLQGLEKGSIVELVVMPDGSLLLRPRNQSRPEKRKQAVIDARGKKLPVIIREAVSLYVAGYNIIDLSYTRRDYEKIVEARNILTRILLGFDVIEEDYDKARFYVVLDEHSLGFWDAYSKMSRTAVSMLEDLATALEAGDEKLAETIVERDDIVDKLYLLQSRQLTLALMGESSLSELGLASYAEALHVFLAIKSVERIADHTSLVASTAPQLIRGGRDSCKIHEVIREEAKLLSKTTSLLRKPDRREAHQIAESGEELRKKTRSCKHQSSPLRLRAYDSLERIASYIQDIAEAAIDILSIRAKTRA